MSTNSVKTDPIVTMICPNLNCGQTVIAPPSARGKVVRCAYCSSPFRVPDVAPPTPDPEPPKQRRA